MKIKFVEDLTLFATKTKSIEVKHNVLTEIEAIDSADATGRVVLRYADGYEAIADELNFEVIEE
jgi:hypothetical protein